MKKRKEELREAVLAEELNALGMLVELFDWVDRLDQSPTRRYDPLQSLAAMVDQVTPRKTKNYATVFALLAGGTRVGSAMAIRCEF